ncbi:MAG TPA: TonB-dependent receptor plug domain-containing protein [Gemmatimonadaceae bacterium]|jgi:outer membrane cobalamin receptor|nr:TonB-dependent receptor plug domain-containing protein [Gemmatimonadaceae bacterium]
MRHAWFTTTPVAACCLAALSACVSTAPRYLADGSQYGDRIITADQIDAELAPNAWELLRQLVPRYNFVEDRAGRAVSINAHRGRSSISVAGSEAPIVIVDGARLSAVDVLQQMPKDAIDRIELRNGTRGTSVEGTNASAGVIYIHTRSGS